jgi:hypothetical protein
MERQLYTVGDDGTGQPDKVVICLSGYGQWRQFRVFRRLNLILLEYDDVFAQIFAWGGLFVGVEFAGVGRPGAYLRFRPTRCGGQGDSQC